VSVGEQIFVVPLVNIVESIQPSKDQIKGISNDNLLWIREQYWPLIPLHKTMQIDNAILEPDKAIVVLIESSKKRFALLVDALVGQQQVVIQSHSAEIMVNLASGICHDFNNNMSVITGNIELLELQNQDVKLNRLINNIKHTSERSGVITKRMLRTSSRNISDKEIVDIDQELTTLVEILAVSIPKNISLISHFNTGRSAFVKKI